jgi:hypothetical protein
MERECQGENEDGGRRCNEGRGKRRVDKKPTDQFHSGGGLRAVWQQSRKLVMKIGPRRIGLIRLFGGLEELDQAIHQAAAAADHVQSALVLMFFEDFVEVFFELRHGNLLLRDSH